MNARNRPNPEDMGLSLTGVDSHAHLDLKNFKSDLAQALQRAVASGVQQIGNVFLGPKAYFKNRQMFQARKEVFFILGVHPHDAAAIKEQDLQKIKTAFDNDLKIKALGEIGLDYYRNYSPKQLQIRCFQQQLELARQNDWPVVIHSRAADEQSVGILLDMGFKDRPLLWHCFGRDKSFARLLVSKGWMLSIPGTVTYKQAEPLQEAARDIPLEKMMLETDCPFLTPEPYRGKRNEPAYTVFTAQKIAELKEMPVQKIWQVCGDNARDFFGLQKN